MPKTSLVVGASTNPSRYSNIAVRKLLTHGHPVFALGGKPGNIESTEIMTGQPELPAIDTITMYLRAVLQEPMYDYLLGLEPTRIIFNPGSENPALMRSAQEAGIEVELACTLVLLNTSAY